MNDPTDGRADRTGLAHLLAHVTKHFAVFSSAAIIIVGLSATIFVYAYLSVFDWRLIWIVEYSDILKVGLVAVAFISGFAFFVFNVTHDVYVWFVDQSTSARGAKMTMAAIWAGLAVLWLFNEYLSPEPHYSLRIWEFASLTYLGLLVIKIGSSVKKGWYISARTLIFDVFFIVAGISTFGHTVGLYVRDTAGFKHNVFLKTGEIRDAGLVMFTSHHMILYRDGRAIVVPSADLVKLEGDSTSQQGRDRAADGIDH
jgi:hypothetical protein